MLDVDQEIARKRVGTTLCGKYRLDALIGVGGMAAVYRGTHRNGHRVAVKVLHAHLGTSEEIGNRFLKEGYVANAVDHAGAVRVLDDDTAQDGAKFLIMELLEGESVETRRIREGMRLAPPEVVRLAGQLLDVLAAAHVKGIIHRDIKPENLFITKDGTLKVLDFGIARMREAGASATQTGRMMGTPAFMPPEQAMGLSREIDGRTDLWAAAATMFTLLTGEYVHQAETVEQMMIYTATRPPRSLASVRAQAPLFPAALVALVDRALAFEKSARFADANEMAAALSEVYPRTSDPGASPLALTTPVRGHPLAGATVPLQRSSRVEPQSVPFASSTGGLSREPLPKIPLGGGGRVALVVGSVVALAAVAGVARSYFRGGAAPAASASQPASPSVPSPPSSGDAVASARPVFVPLVPSATASSAPSDTPSAMAVTVPKTPRPSSAVQTSPNRTVVVAPIRSTVPSAAAPPSVKKVDCDPPFTIDAAGVRRVKPGC
jgi:serine/threonine-protein kinase